MTQEENPTTEPDRRDGIRASVVASTLALLLSLVAIWSIAVPRLAVCPAIYPAPPGCTQGDRVLAGGVASLLVLGVYAVAVAVARTIGRTRTALLVGAPVLVAVAGVVGYQVTLYSTGFLIG